jgi:uncharacterized membrane protein
VITRKRGELSRLEAFSDAVFAFALTLLVVSLEVPRSYDELLQALHNFIAFAITFAALVWIWYQHYVFFHRYGLSDAVMVTLNAALLFVVLLYVYPLKFLCQYLVDHALGIVNSATPTIEPSQTAGLVIVYGLGYLAVFGAFLLMYLYAYARRRELRLTRLELFDTRYEIQVNLINVGTALASVSVAIMGGASAAIVAGLLYFLLGPVRAVHGMMSGRRRRKLERSTSTA